MTPRTQALETLTLTRRLLRTRGVAVYLLLVVAAPLVILKAARETWAWATEPRLALAVERDLRVHTLPGYWEGMEEGDQLVAVGGEPVSSLAEIEAIEERLPEGPVVARVERAGQAIDVRGAKAAPGPVMVTALGVRWATGVFLLLAGLVTFLLRPGTRASWLFLFFCHALAAIQLGILVFHPDPGLRTLVGFAAIPIASGLAVHFFAEFPRRAPALARRPWLALLAHLPAAVLVPAFAAIYDDIENPTLDPQLGILLWGALSSLLAIRLILAQRRRARERQDAPAQAQARALVVAIVGGVLPTVAIGMAWTLGLVDFPGVAHVSTAPLAFFAAAVGYTVVRHNAFEIDRFAAAVVGYGAMLALVAIACGVLMLATPLLLGELGVARSPELYVFVTAAAFIAFLPLYRRLRRRVDGWFLRSRLDAGAQARLLRELGGEVQSGDRDRGLASALEAAMAPGGERAQVWLLDEGGGLLRRAAQRGVRPSDEEPAFLLCDGPLGRALAAADQPRGVQGMVGALLPEDAQAELWRLELVLAAPVRSHGALVGFLGVGRKLSGGAFDEAEATFLAAVATQVELLLERAGQESLRLGRYRLGKRLGTGGMAEVHLAWQLGPGGFERKVAIKRPLPHLMDDPQCVAMFLDEARIAAQLSHRNICGILEIDRQEESYFIAMEFIDGPSVRGAIRIAAEQKRPPPVPVAAAIGACVLDALACAHGAVDDSGASLGLVHRDVTPGNVLLSRAGEVKLVDFGVARAAERLSATRTGSIKGTEAYMSPEQAAGDELDARADLYAAAATLYELFTTSRTFAARRGKEAVPPATRLRSDLPAGLDAFFARATAANAEDRPASATAMKEELLAAVAPYARGDEAAVAAWLRELSGAPREEEGPTTALTERDRSPRSR